LKIAKSNLFFTDNTNEICENSIFVSSKQNEKFLDTAKNSNAKEIIHENDLKNYFDFSKIQVVGITGTNGKTTTAAAIYSFLLDLGYKVALQGTRGFYVNDTKVKEYSLTTPVQLEIFDNIQQALQDDCEFFIMEVSSHAIAQNRICGIDFALKIHTNITADHLDYHKTLEEYIAIKNSFFNDDTPKLINRDDKKVKFKMKNAFSYSLDNPSTYKVQAFAFQEETSVVIQHFGELFTFYSDLRGTFNVYNLVCALASVHILTKRNLSEICEVVENFAGVSGRMETISQDPLVVIDFAHTADGMKAIFESYKDKNIIVVFGAGGDRDKTKRPHMGKMADEYSKYIFVTSDNPRFEDPDTICDEIVAGIKDKSKLTVDINRKAAIYQAINKSKELDNSVVLVLGKGDEEHQIIYDQKLPLSDKKTILDILGV
jgi:UDP-N-acetylmuramoyl-L-alanyl-D-glutamate--2,6-diaminopimelate ligase